MKIVIVGCGRVGAELAAAFDGAGHDVVVLDLRTDAFDRLPTSFSGQAVRGDGTDEDVLERAGARGRRRLPRADRGRQPQRHGRPARRTRRSTSGEVIAKINDPVRAEAYADLGIATLCRTNLMSDAIIVYLGLPTPSRPGVLAPTGSHPGGEHHDLAAAGAAGGTGAGAAPPATPFAPTPGSPSRTED